MSSGLTAACTHRVLLVEDNPADVFLLEASIDAADLPLSLTVVEDGVAALEWLEGVQAPDLPELLLLDLNMPRMNGFEVLQALSGHLELCRLPVVMLSTSAAAVDRAQSLALGARAYVTKPHGFTEVAELLGRVVAVLRGQAGWDTL